MYLRHTTVEKSGKKHTDWRLVRSVRTGSRVRQETVATLGELDAAGRARAEALARQFTGAEDFSWQQELFGCPVERVAPVPVRLDRVRVERGRRFGDVWLGWTLWKALKLDEWSMVHLSDGRQEIPWSIMAPSWSSHASANHPAGCTSQRTGTDAPRWTTFSESPRRR